MKVEDALNGYTNEDLKLDREIARIMKSIIKREIIENETPVSEFMYVAYHAIHEEVLMQRLIHKKELMEQNKDDTRGD